MGLHDKHGPRAARPAAARPEPKRPAAPPAYRPQPTPKVLQRKEAMPPRRPPVSPAAPSAPPPAPPARRPPQQPRAWQPKPAAPPPLPPVAARPAAVQRKTGPVVQAIKLYPNLHPGAVERVEPGSLFRLENFTDQYRLRREQGHGAYVPNQQYNFVRTAEGQTLLHNRYRHPSIAEGRQVLYAGEAHFNNGRLEWWSNGSGHYQPDSEDAGQAGLPMDNFYTYQQVIKGEHKRKRTGPPSRK